MKRFFVNNLILAALVLSAAFTSCDDKDDKEKTVAVTGVSLDQTTLTFTVGDVSKTLTATVAPVDATNGAVTWNIAPAGVATVVNGVVTPAAPGTATITVTTTDGSKTATCTVTVNASTVTVIGVTLEPATLTLEEGETETLVPNVAPANASDNSVTWTSDKPEVATVENGVVTAVSAGTATITVTTTDGAKTATCTVTVNAKATVVFDDETLLTQTVFADETPQALSFVTTGAWTSTQTADWLSISPGSGAQAGEYTVTVSLAPNDTGADRSETISITCNDEIINVNVTQKATNRDGTPYVPEITVTNDAALEQTVYADDTAAESVTFVTKGAWTSTKTPSTADWVSILQESGTEAGTYSVNFALQKNATGSSRTAAIKITCGNTSINVKIKQKATNMDFVPTVVDIEMIFVEGGTFTMGSTPDYDNAYPPHQVTLSSFNIGKFQITQGQWEAIMGSNPSYFKKGDNYPVERVSWDDVQEFINELNALTGKNYRLPTEAEWEYAARDRSSNGYSYSGSSIVGDVAWYSTNSASSTHEVGTKAPNQLGIYDMSGNVFEWCSDLYGRYSSSAQTNPTGPSTGSGRTYRGGCWLNTSVGCRVSFRPEEGAPEDIRSNMMGFRLALP